ncbi:MAG: glycosyltransferase [Fibrobacteria bacterium]|nr:glycosyltransferase [Fibrobacteria bacterium]
MESSNFDSNLTIGITAFNEGMWLRECWESVLAQSTNNWRAVLVLDGGADKLTRDVFESIEHPRLKKIALTKNIGPFPARTLAIETSVTEWYFHLDADDHLPGRSVEVINNAIENNPDADFIYGPAYFFGSGYNRVIPYHDYDEESLLFYPNVLGVSPITKTLFKKVGGFCRKLDRTQADWDFWIGVWEAGAKGIRVNEVTYNVRHRFYGNTGSNWRYERDKVARIVIENHPIFFNNEKRINKCMAFMHEQMAGDYRTCFKYKEAALNARKAIEYGSSMPFLKQIIKDEVLPGWQIRLRKIVKHLKLFLILKKYEKSRRTLH